MIYYLDQAEVRFLTHELLPRIRSNPVDERLRGWNWHQPPLKPYTYEIPLSVWEVAARICPTNRDVWVRRRIIKRSVPTTPHIAKGIIIHRIISGLFKEAKKNVYLGMYRGLREKLVNRGAEIIEEEIKNMSRYVDLSRSIDEIRGFGSEIIEYLAISIENKVLEVKAKYPFLDHEGLVNLVFPFAVELAIDGRFLGLSRYLRADASWIFGGIVYDVKTGYRQRWHRIQVAGYALAIESFYERPVDIGGVIYVSRSRGGLRIEKDFFPITDDLRSRFLENRDELQMMLLKDKEPPVADKCPKTCLLHRYCHGG